MAFPQTRFLKYPVFQKERENEESIKEKTNLVSQTRKEEIKILYITLLRNGQHYLWKNSRKTSNVGMLNTWHCKNQVYALTEHLVGIREKGSKVMHLHCLFPQNSAGMLQIGNTPSTELPKEATDSCLEKGSL